MSDMPAPAMNSLRSWKGDKSYWTYFGALEQLKADQDQPDTRFGPVQRVTDPVPDLSLAEYNR